jgi:ribosome-binding protein aMBF1 (putative translation factor)
MEIDRMNKRIEMKSFTGHLDERYGKIGTEKRNAFERKSRPFIVGEMLREARRSAKMTQDELARRSRTKKSYISRLENGKIDVQISTLFRIFEDGLGRTIDLTIR